MEFVLTIDSLPMLKINVWDFQQAVKDLQWIVCGLSHYTDFHGGNINDFTLRQQKIRQVQTLKTRKGCIQHPMVFDRVHEVTSLL